MKAIDTILHYMFFCHRIPERSFSFKGKQFPLCARCTGILVGYILGIIYIVLFRKINIVLELILFIPIAVDGLGQLYGYWESNNIRRFITGIIAGIATVCFIRVAWVAGIISGSYVRNLIIS